MNKVIFDGIKKPTDSLLGFLQQKESLNPTTILDIVGIEWHLRGYVNWNA